MSFLFLSGAQWLGYKTAFLNNPKFRSPHYFALENVHLGACTRLSVQTDGMKFICTDLKMGLIEETSEGSKENNESRINMLKRK